MKKLWWSKKSVFLFLFALAFALTLAMPYTPAAFGLSNLTVEPIRIVPLTTGTIDLNQFTGNTWNGGASGAGWTYVHHNNLSHRFIVTDGYTITVTGTANGLTQILQFFRDSGASGSSTVVWDNASLSRANNIGGNIVEIDSLNAGSPLSFIMTDGLIANTGTGLGSTLGIYGSSAATLTINGGAVTSINGTAIQVFDGADVRTRVQ